MEASDSLQLNSQSTHNVRERAQWERSRVITFCDICKRELESGNRSGGSLKKFAWTNIATKFKNETGLTYDGQQMKHKWDTLKKEWKNWRILKQLASGLGWNPRKGTIDATDDWWDRNIKANPEIAKFRAKGIDPELEDKLSFLFDGIVAKGDDMWSPSAGSPPRRFFEVSSSSQFAFEDVDIHSTPMEEFVVDLGIPDLNDDHEKEDTRGGSTGVEIIQNPIKKRPSGSSSTQKKKLCKKKLGGASMLSTKLDEIKGEFDKHRETIMSRVGKLPPTISEAVEVLMDMKDDVPPCGNLYRFATKLLLDKDKREMFMAQKSYDKRLWYLKVEESEAAANEAHNFTSLLRNNNFNFPL